MSVTTRVITFNCLSPHYALEEYFPEVKPAYLDENYRLEKLISLLKSFFKVNFIIALQELCEKWYPFIESICKESSYSLIYRSYSSGKMGVAIAFPTKHYLLLDTDIFCPPLKVRENMEKLRSVDASEEDTISSIDRVVKEYDIAENKAFENIQISLLLRCIYKGHDSRKEIIVSTYHMPCRFDQQRYMVCQAYEFIKHLSDLYIKYFTMVRDTNLQLCEISKDTVHFARYYSPESIDIIFMGDTNVDSKSVPYTILTGDFKQNEIKAPEIHDMIKSYSALDIDTLNIITLTSAYKLKDGKEPDYTNVKFKNPSDPKSQDFFGCIDYILVSQGVKTKSAIVGLTPKKGDLLKPYPNAICPSDHLPLSASLILS